MGSSPIISTTSPNSLLSRIADGPSLGYAEHAAISQPLPYALMGERCPTRDRPPPAISCHAVTSWSSTEAFGTLAAENKSPRTIEAYTDAVRLLATYLQAHGGPLVAGELRREHIQKFSADQLIRGKPATAQNRYRGLHAFFKWAVAEVDREINPMERMKPPQLPEQPVAVVGPEHLARLLKTCEGRDFTSRRDTAAILLLVDTGMRRARCAGMSLDDVDLGQRIVWVLGKGRPRIRTRAPYSNA